MDKRTSQSQQQISGENPRVLHEVYLRVDVMPLKYPPSHGMDQAARTARARVDVESRNNSASSENVKLQTTLDTLNCFEVG